MITFLKKISKTFQQFKNKKKVKKIFFKFFYKKYLIIPFPLILCVLTALVVLQGGFFHPEADYFLHNSLNEKPFFANIFNAENHRDGAYQAREFSYVIDSIDAHILLASARLGIVHFYSLLHYASLLLIASLAILMSSRYFGQKSYAVSILTSLLFLTTPAVFLGGNYYRSSKYLVALFVILIIYFLFRYFSEKKVNIKISLLIPLLGFLMAISDKQGSFLLSAFILTTAFVFVVFLVKGSLRSIIILVSLILMEKLYIYYSDTFAPQLIKYFTGKYPVFAPTSETFAYIQVIPAYKDLAISYFNYQFSYFFGNGGEKIGATIAIILGILFIFIAFKQIAKDKSLFRLFEVRSTTLYIPMLLIATIPMVGIMLHYSTAFVTWPDVRIVYYNLPVLVLILLFVQIIFARLILLFPGLNRILIIILSIVLLFNILALPSHYHVLRSGHLKIHFDASPYLKLCIYERDKSEKLFTGLLTQHADEACVLFRSLLGEHVKNPIAASEDEKNNDCEYWGIKRILIKGNLTSMAINPSTTEISIGMLPDNKFYIIKVLRDKIVFFLLCSSQEKMAFYLLQSDKLMRAGLLLVEKREISLAKETILKAENNYTLLLTEYAKVFWIEDQVSPAMNTAIKSAALKHQKILTQIIADKRLSQEDRKTFEQVLEFSKRNYKQIFVFEEQKNKMKTK